MLQDLAQLPLLPAQPQPTLEAEEPARANLNHNALFFEDVIRCKCQAPCGLKPAENHLRRVVRLWFDGSKLAWLWVTSQHDWGSTVTFAF